MLKPSSQEHIFPAEGWTSEGFRVALTVKVIFYEFLSDLPARLREKDRLNRMVSVLKGRLLDEAGKLSCLEIRRSREAICIAALRQADGGDIEDAQVVREVRKKFGLQIAHLIIDDDQIDPAIQKQVDETALAKILAHQQLQHLTEEKHAKLAIWIRMMTCEIPDATIDDRMRAFERFSLYDYARAPDIDKKLVIGNLDAPVLEAITRLLVKAKILPSKDDTE